MPYHSEASAAIELLSTACYLQRCSFSPFITSEAIHSSLKQMHHAKGERECEIRLPQLCWFILKSFAVHKSSAAEIFHLPFSCSTLQPCADKNECLGQNPTTSALIFLLGFSPVCWQLYPPMISLYLPMPLNWGTGQMQY